MKEIDKNREEKTNERSEEQKEVRENNTKREETNDEMAWLWTAEKEERNEEKRRAKWRWPRLGMKTTKKAEKTSTENH